MSSSNAESILRLLLPAGLICMIDAAGKIYKTEGFNGLYRGFWVSSVQLVSGVMYIATYEGVRHILTQHNASASTKSLIGGGCASVIGQTIIVPFDILSQHLMVLGLAQVTKGNKSKRKEHRKFYLRLAASILKSSTGLTGYVILLAETLCLFTSRFVADVCNTNLNPLGISLEPGKSKLRLTLDIAQAIYYNDGIRGFYRGYIASLCTYVPNSALWWAFYHIYQEELGKVLPNNTSHLLIQCVAGTLGGFTTTLITNPMDTIRARLQVHRTNTMMKTFQTLWREDGIRMLSKGLSARLVQSVCFSFSIILGYETIKRISIRQEYKELVRW